MKYTEKEYLNFDPCGGDMVSHWDLRCLTAKIVKTKKEHKCHLSLIEGKPHKIPVGNLARYEKCIFEGRWDWNWCCLPCIDKCLDDD